MAGISLAQKVSPSPRPMTSGEELLATTMRSGAASEMTATA